MMANQNNSAGTAVIRERSGNMFAKKRKVTVLYKIAYCIHLGAGREMVPLSLLELDPSRRS